MQVGYVRGTDCIVICSWTEGFTIFRVQVLFISRSLLTLPPNKPQVNVTKKKRRSAPYFVSGIFLHNVLIATSLYFLNESLEYI